MMNSLGDKGSIVKKKPEGWADPSGLQVPSEGQVVIFQTTDELRIWGPVGLREWLKRNRPPGRQLRDTGAVLEFDRGRHQIAAARSGSSEGGGS
jgi:hypothetical protein